MNIFLYIIIFLMGTLFGSFYTLAVYRIPNGIDIISTHSFCPNCNHKLGFFELIPVFSYIILGGKCKECKQKIRPRYFILEILSGLTFVLIAYGLKLNAYNLNLNAIIRFAFIALYLVALFIIAGIDKEHRKIEKNVLYYSVFVSCSYIIYLCIMGETSIYRYVMYLITLIILLVIDSLLTKYKAENSYLIDTLMLISVMFINTGIEISLLTVATAIIALLVGLACWYISNSSNKFKKENLNILEIYKFGYLFSITNVILLIGSFYL